MHHSDPSAIAKARLPSSPPVCQFVFCSGVRRCVSRSDMVFVQERYGVGPGVRRCLSRSEKVALSMVYVYGEVLFLKMVLYGSLLRIEETGLRFGKVGDREFLVCCGFVFPSPHANA
eukprot:jgi/Botrbrau1/14184/Bobra.182_3s0117.1